VYALTVVLYELLTGQVPFTADTPVGVVIKTLNDPLPMPQSICPDIGDEVQKVVIKGTAKSLDERYDTVTSFRIALTAALKADASRLDTNGHTTLVFPRTLEREPAARKRNSTPMIAAAVAVAAVAGGAFYWNTTHQAAPSQTAASIVAVSKNSGTPESVPAAALSTPEPSHESKPVADASRDAGATPAIDVGTTTSKAPVDMPTVVAQTRTADGGVKNAVASHAKSLAKNVEVPEPKVERAGSAPDVQPSAEASQSQAQTTQTSAPSPAPTQVSATSAAVTQAAAPPAASGGEMSEVQKGVTTQRDLLKRFGGPNLTTYDDSGREVWVYERTSTQTEVRSNSQSREASASIGLFFKSIDVGASGSKEKSSGSASSASAIRSITVMVTFAPDRTVYDYTVRSTYF
jgi:hypothetical protein